MEDTDSADITKETLQEQYTSVKKSTTKSPVLQWGELDFTTEPIADFQSNQDATKATFWDQMIHDGLQLLDDTLELVDDSVERKNTFAVDSRDIKLHYYYNKVMTNPTKENHAALQAEIAHRVKVDGIFDKIFDAEHMELVRAGNTAPVQNFDCLRSMINLFEEKCEKMDDYSLKYAKAFVQECETNTYKLGLESSLAKINNACPE